MGWITKFILKALYSHNLTLVEIFTFWCRIKVIYSYIGTEFIYWYRFKVFIEINCCILIQNLKLILLLLDRHCTYATHLRIQGLDPALLIATITNSLGW